MSGNLNSRLVSEVFTPLGTGSSSTVKHWSHHEAVPEF